MSTRLGPRAVGLLGLALVVAGYLWSAIKNYLASRNDPPGWIVDRSISVPGMFVILAGILLLIASVMVALAVRIMRHFSK